MRRNATWFAMAAAMAAFVVALCGGGTAEAGPLCSSLGPIPLAAFDSCVTGGNDHLPSVQLVLDAVLEPNVVLNGALSFSPGPESAGGEFNGDNAAAGFNITPNTVGNTNSFEFISLPTGTQFVTIKQATQFEIFYVGDLTLPFTLTHQIVPSTSTSHISTFAAPSAGSAAVPEPSALILLGLGVSWLAARGSASRG